MNIQDIANLAGVSKSTVSRYLNQGSISLKQSEKFNTSLIHTVMNRTNLLKV